MNDCVHSSPFYSENGVFLIAEVGGNHEGDFGYAKELLHMAAESGADAVKFQIYTGESLVNPRYDPERVAHFNRFALSREQYVELAELCGSLGTRFMASVWDPGMFEEIDPYMPIYKVGSGDLTAYDFLARCAATGKPIILSTGLATLAEIRDAVAFIAGKDGRYLRERRLALLQCTAMYPAPDDQANLKVMDVLREETGLPVGYSDHTRGVKAVEVAVAMGAEIIEVHFSDNPEKTGFRDHQVSLSGVQVKQFLETVKQIRCLQGDGVKAPMPVEIDSGHVHSFRRGVYLSRDGAAGEVIEASDLVTLRPLRGISARFFFRVVGKRLRRAVQRHEALNWDDFEN